MFIFMYVNMSSIVTSMEEYLLDHLKSRRLSMVPIILAILFPSLIIFIVVSIIGFRLKSIKSKDNIKKMMLDAKRTSFIQNHLHAISSGWTWYTFTEFSILSAKFLVLFSFFIFCCFYFSTISD